MMGLGWGWSDLEKRDLESGPRRANFWFHNSNWSTPRDVEDTLIIRIYSKRMRVHLSLQHVHTRYLVTNLL